MIVTNRMQLWVEIPKIVVDESTRAFFDQVAIVFSVVLWSFLAFMIGRAVVLNIQDRRRKKRVERNGLPPYRPPGEGQKPSVRSRG